MSTAVSKPFLESISNTENDDTEITPETAADLARARESFAPWEAIDHEEILREFGISK